MKKKIIPIYQFLILFFLLSALFTTFISIIYPQENINKWIQLQKNKYYTLLTTVSLWPCFSSPVAILARAVTIPGRKFEKVRLIAICWSLRNISKFFFWPSADKVSMASILETQKQCKRKERKKEKSTLLMHPFQTVYKTNNPLKT